MTESVRIAFALIAGLLLGAFFFGGLWWTVRRSLLHAQPATLFIGSLVLRMLITLVGFWFVFAHAGSGDWRMLLACMLGFLIARVVATRLGPKPRDKTPPKKPPEKAVVRAEAGPR